MQRREDFYRTTGDRAGSSCSDDSVLGDMAQDHEEWVRYKIYYFSHVLTFELLQISSYVGDKNQFYSPEDSISLSLEYYQACLDKTEIVNSTKKVTVISDKVNDDVKKTDCAENLLKHDRRYLQCPAAVTMSHLQKFIRMKYGLTSEHRVSSTV